MKSFVRHGRAEFCVEDSRIGGSPLVCLHAGVCDRRMWAQQVVALRAGRRVLAYDRRGFGETRCASAEPFDHVGDLIALLDARGLGAAVLVGCSQGGRIAIDAALAHPTRVRALVLVACSVSGAPADSGGPFAPAVQKRLDALEAAEACADHAAINELEAQLWLDGPAQRTGRVGNPLRELFLEMNGSALAAPSPGEPIEPPSAWERLGDLRVPALIVWGTLDFAHIDARMHTLVQRMPHAKPFVMDDVAHLPGLEQPEVFNAAVARFLDAL